MSPTPDRPAAIRRALRDLVAERGFHGASMGAVAKEAGVATGTAYVHYESKDELVFATYLEIKAGLGEAVLEDFDRSASPSDQWSHMLKTSYRYFEEEPDYEFLHDLQADPDQLKNLVEDPGQAKTLARMRKRCDELRDSYTAR